MDYKQITVDGTSLPLPSGKEGLSETFSKLWSENTGRNSKGEMVGTVVREMTKVQLKWTGLTPAQSKTIISAVSGGFKTLTYPSLKTGGQRSIKGYFGDCQTSDIALNGKVYFAKAVSVDFIEK